MRRGGACRPWRGGARGGEGVACCSSRHQQLSLMSYTLAGGPGMLTGRENHGKEMEALQTKLFEAAIQGSINSLQQLLKDDPLILDRAAVNCFNETPLHVAAMLGHVNFVKEIIGIKVELVEEVNSQQSTALHLAAAKGHAEVVRALLSVSREACLVLDRNGLTPLHAKGRVEVVKQLLEAQPEAAYRGESILHLCVKRNQLQALEVLVKGLRGEAFINSRDADGNTTLHLAVADKQVETVKLLVSAGVEVNAINDERKTALDILMGSKRDVRDPEIEKSLDDGDQRATTNNTKARGRAGAGAGAGGKYEKNSWKDLVKRHDEWLEKTKSSLMVVSVLIATMAFQIGVNPPGGVWQEDGKSTNEFGQESEAGTSVLAHFNPSAYKLFCIVNTVAFIAPLSVILLLLSGLPLRRKFFMWFLMLLTWISISAIAYTYLFAIAWAHDNYMVHSNGYTPTRPHYSFDTQTD